MTLCLLFTSFHRRTVSLASRPASKRKIETAMELRKTKRYEVAASTVYCWPGTADYMQSCEGVTHDLSISGVFIEAAICPPTGARVDFDILLPPMDGAEYSTRLRGDGMVLRAEECQGPGRKAGFAAAVQFYAEEPETAFSRTFDALGPTQRSMRTQETGD